MPRIDWSKADWSKSNMQIALNLGTTANTAAHVRKKLGAPPAPPRKQRWIPFVNRAKKAA